MEYIPIRKNTKLSEEVKRVYVATFPKDEQTSFETLLDHADDESVRFIACYEQEVLVSFVFYVDTADGIFVLFFAVNPRLQGKGYGRTICRDLFGTRLAEKTVMFDIEDPEQGTEDAGNRMRRLTYYEQLGMRRTKYRIWNGDVMFRVMSSTGEGDVWRYMDFIDTFCGCDSHGTPLEYTVYQDDMIEPLSRPFP